MPENPLPDKCTKCGKPFEQGDKFFYDMLDDDPSLDDICESCSHDISMMAFGIIPIHSEIEPK